MKNSDWEKQLVEGCLQNDRQCQQQLYDTFAPKMLAVCMRYADTHPEAEDIMIEGFVTVFSHLNDFRGNSSLEYWIRRIMVNKALSNYRSNKKHYNYTVIEEAVQIEDDLSSDIETTMTGRKIIEYIQQMPENLRMVFNLRIFEEYGFKEIGKEIGIPESSARVYFLRAKQWINQRISK
ncbi:MAG: sigma-70 family RNA polymerase sigma factor [Bacteroidales bacterium]|nr:sigma-70 family RNA polymerase sigma factor [Bacteroidales bacterium]